MADDRKAFTFFRSYYEAASQLPKTQRLSYYDAVVKYALDGEEPLLTGVAKAMFILSKPNLDTSISKAQAGAKGGKSRSENYCEEMHAGRKQNSSTSEANLKQTPSDKDKDIGERIQDKDKDTVIPAKTPADVPFEKFWKAYPKKVGKGAASRAWGKLRPGQKLEDTILQAVELAKKSREWTRESGQYIPYPATWLNEGRWEDELTPGILTPDDPSAMQQKFGEPTCDEIKRMELLRDKIRQEGNI